MTEHFKQFCKPLECTPSTHCPICSTTLVQIHTKIVECPTCGYYEVEPYQFNSKMSGDSKSFLYSMYMSKIKHPCNTDELLRDTLQNCKRLCKMYAEYGVEGYTYE